jgi:NAD(P) transhydrogenase
MSEPAYDYDLLVIGTGPAGQRAAIQAAKLRKRVAIIERRDVMGGVCINTGTIPSKTLREAVLYFSGYRERGFYGDSYRVKDKITTADLLQRCRHVILHEIDVIRNQMRRNGVEMISATARFTNPHTLHLRYSDNRGSREVTAAHIIIATGTTPAHPTEVAFDGRTIFDSDGILDMDTIPRTMVVVGAGVIGTEYASMFAALGVRVTLMDARPDLLPFVDTEIVETLEYHLRMNRATMRLGETVQTVEPTEDGRVQIRTASGKEILTECVMYCAGRQGATALLDLDSAGLSADSRGRLAVNEQYQTAEPHIYAVGDVIGFPSLASTSMEQGRLAACHAFGVPATSNPAYFPYGIFTIPEISMVGRTEQELTDEGVSYEVGKAHYREVARGQIIGDTTGMLKLIFHIRTRELLGVHIIGEGASELVHVGQAALALGGSIDYFINTVFNYPTLAEAYKVAAFDGVNRMAG